MQADDGPSSAVVQSQSPHCDFCAELPLPQVAAKVALRETAVLMTDKAPRVFSPAAPLPTSPATRPRS